MATQKAESKTVKKADPKAHGQLSYSKIEFLERNQDGSPNEKGETKVVRKRVMLTPLQARQLNDQTHNSAIKYEENKD